MPTPSRSKLACFLLLLPLMIGCASKPRQLMPTPDMYRLPTGEPVFTPEVAVGQTPDIDLLYITDRAPETNPETGLPYGETRGTRVRFGSAVVKVGRGLSWDTVAEQSQLAERTVDVDMALGNVQEINRFPVEPYQVYVDASGDIYRDDNDMRQHRAAKKGLQDEVKRRLKGSKSREVLLYVHGFNETFATAAYTTSELCHFLGREDVCAFFTWPASASGDFLTAYTSTTETAQFAVDHLKKTIRMLAGTPGITGINLLAHSRGTAVMLEAVRELFLETIAAGVEPNDEYKIDNLVLFSPDIDVELGAQAITAHVSDPDVVSVWPTGRLPRSLRKSFTIYGSPNDRALLVSKILFRSSSRIGNMRPEDFSQEGQEYLQKIGGMDFIINLGERTDSIGHSYFTSNPSVSSDLIQLLRHGRKPGEPGRPLERKGPVVWVLR